VNTNTSDLDEWLEWAKKRARKRPHDLQPRMIAALIAEVRRLRELLGKEREASGKAPD
jgi:hypothetical protein